MCFIWYLNQYFDDKIEKLKLFGMKKIFIALIIICISTETNAQNISQLEIKLSETGDSTQYLVVLNELALAYYKTDVAKSQSYSSQAIGLSMRLGLKSEEVKARLNYGDCLSKNNQMDNAFNQYSQSLSISKSTDDPILIASCYQKLGNFHLRQQQLDQAENHYMNVIAIRKRLGDEKGLSSIFNNMVVLKEQQGKTDEAIQYLNESLAIRRRLGNPSELALTLNRLANFQLKNGDFVEAKRNFEEILQLIDETKDKRTVVNTINSLSSCNIELGQFIEAQKLSTKALTLAEELNDPDILHATLFNQASIAYYIGNYKEGIVINQKVIDYLKSSSKKEHLSMLQPALVNHFSLHSELGISTTDDWFRKAIEMKPDDKLLANIYLNYARYHSIKDNIEQNYMYAQKAYNLRAKADKITSAMSIGQLGIAMQKMGKTKEALPLLQKGLMELDKLQSTNGQLFIKSSILNIKSSVKALQNQAIKDAQQVLSLAETSGSAKEKEVAYSTLAFAYESAGYKDQALKYYKLKQKLKDSLLQTADYQSVADINAKAKLQDTLQSAKTATESAKSELILQKKSNLWQKILFAILLTTIALGLYRWFSRKSVVLGEQHARELAQAELKLLLEKKRISSDLHDEVGSVLSSISIMSHSAMQNLEDQYNNQKFQAIGERAQEAMESIQDIVWACNPTNERLYKLIQRIVRFGSEILESKGINLNVDNLLNDASTQHLLSLEQRKDLYLILKELIHNIAKHSRATFVTLRFDQKGSKLHFQILDDGIPFDINDGKLDDHGNGLKNIHSRISTLKGNISTLHTHNSINTTELYVPLEHNVT